MNRVSTCCICFSPVTCIKEESELVKKRREMLKRISVHQGWRLVVAKDCSLLETPLCVSCEEKLNKMSTAITCKNVPGVSKQYGEIQRMVIDSEILNLKLKKKFQRVATELRNKIIEDYQEKLLEKHPNLYLDDSGSLTHATGIGHYQGEVNASSSTNGALLSGSNDQGLTNSTSVTNANSSRSDQDQIAGPSRSGINTGGYLAQKQSAKAEGKEIALWYCPICVEGETRNVKKKMIRCDDCKVWFHWDCMDITEDVESHESWHCGLCN